MCFSYQKWISTASVRTSSTPGTYIVCVSVCQCEMVHWCDLFIIYTIFSYLSQNSPEEITVATGYLTLFLLHITNVQLMRTFLQFIISGECDGQPVVNSLIQNISSDSQQVDIKSPSSLLFLLLLILLFSAFSLSSPKWGDRKQACTVYVLIIMP